MQDSHSCDSGSNPDISTFESCFSALCRRYQWCFIVFRCYMQFLYAVSFFRHDTRIYIVLAIIII